jgi:hypothetical protein
MAISFQSVRRKAQQLNKEQGLKNPSKQNLNLRESKLAQR